MNDSKLLPGRIVTYYPENQTADIKISAERIFNDTTALLQLTEREVLLGVPVHTPYGGGWSVTFPIKPGDTCLLAFSQIGYDHWLYQDKDTGGTVAKQPVPHLRRQFSEDDGFAMVGFNTIPRAIQGYSNSHSQWRNADVSQIISLNDDGTIEVTSPITVTIDAPQTIITGHLTVNGNINTTGTYDNSEGSMTITGDVIAGSGIRDVSLLNHTHPENDGGDTGIPN